MHDRNSPLEILMFYMIFYYYPMLPFKSQTGNIPVRLCVQKETDVV